MFKVLQSFLDTNWVQTFDLQSMTMPTIATNSFDTPYFPPPTSLFLPLLSFF